MKTIKLNLKDFGEIAHHQIAFKVRFNNKLDSRIKRDSFGGFNKQLLVSVRVIKRSKK